MQAGLCDSCSHQRLVVSGRGSSFSLCRRALEDPSFPRYPRLPVGTCRGHEPRSDVGTGGVAGATADGDADAEGRPPGAG